MLCGCCHRCVPLGKLRIGSPRTWIRGSAVQHGHQRFWVFNQLFSIPPRQWDWISHVSVCEWYCTNMCCSFWITHYIRIDLHDNSSSTQGEHATYETMMRYWSFQFQRWAISEMGAIWINVPIISPSQPDDWTQLTFISFVPFLRLQHPQHPTAIQGPGVRSCTSPQWMWPAMLLRGASGG